jgi:hypothetical protein
MDRRTGQSSLTDSTYLTLTHSANPLRFCQSSFADRGEHRTAARWTQQAWQALGELTLMTLSILYQRLGGSLQATTNFRLVQPSPRSVLSILAMHEHDQPIQADKRTDEPQGGARSDACELPLPPSNDQHDSAKKNPQWPGEHPEGEKVATRQVAGRIPVHDMQQRPRRAKPANGDGGARKGRGRLHRVCGPRHLSCALAVCAVVRAITAHVNRRQVQFASGTFLRSPSPHHHWLERPDPTAIARGTPHNCAACSTRVQSS